MPPVYRMVETAVYSLLNFLPFLVLALYPFRHNLRFSKGITALLKGLLSIIQVLLGHGSASGRATTPRQPAHSVRHYTRFFIFSPSKATSAKRFLLF